MLDRELDVEETEDEELDILGLLDELLELTEEEEVSEAENDEELIDCELKLKLMLLELLLWQLSLKLWELDEGLELNCTEYDEELQDDDLEAFGAEEDEELLRLLLSRLLEMLLEEHDIEDVDRLLLEQLDDKEFSEELQLDDNDDGELFERLLLEETKENDALDEEEEGDENIWLLELELSPLLEDARLSSVNLDELQEAELWL